MRLFAVGTRDDESCQLVIPHDHRHKEVYNALIMRTEPKTEVFLAKPTETDRHQNLHLHSALINTQPRHFTYLNFFYAVVQSTFISIRQLA